MNCGCCQTDHVALINFICHGWDELFGLWKLSPQKGYSFNTFLKTTYMQLTWSKIYDEKQINFSPNDKPLRAWVHNLRTWPQGVGTGYFWGALEQYENDDPQLNWILSHLQYLHIINHLSHTNKLKSFHKVFLCYSFTPSMTNNNSIWGDNRHWMGPWRLIYIGRGRIIGKDRKHCRRAIKRHVAWEHVSTLARQE